MAEEETWDWIDGAKATGQGAAEGYAEGGIVGAALGGLKGYLGYASDHPGVGTLYTSQGRETRAEIDRAATLGVLRAEWGTVGGFAWTHPEGAGRQFNGQKVDFRLRYLDGGLWTQNLHRNAADAQAAGVSHLTPDGMGYQKRDPSASYELNGRTFTGYDDPALAYLAIECEGAWGDRPVLSFRNYPKAMAQRELFAMGYVGALPAETVYVEAAVLWGQQGSPNSFQSERTILQGIGLVRKSWPIVVIWRTQKRGARDVDRLQWTYGVQMIPPGDAVSYGPNGPNGVTPSPGKSGIGLAGWAGVAGLGLPVLLGLVKR